jgi:hypothetical protein
MIMANRPLTLALLAFVLITLLTSCASNPNANYSHLPEPAQMDVVEIQTGNETEYTPTSDLLFAVMAGELSGKLGDLESSQVYYAQVLELTDDPDIIERAMRVAIRSKDWPQALHAAKRWAAVSQKGSRLNKYWAYYSLASGM